MLTASFFTYLTTDNLLCLLRADTSHSLLSRLCPEMNYSYTVTSLKITICAAGIPPSPQRDPPNMVWMPAGSHCPDGDMVGLVFSP